jgi:AraC-like DNA-binding protein
MLDRLREALLSGQTDASQALVIQMFGSDDLTPEDFLQIFYSIRGVVLAVADKVECEDVRFLCTYDRRKPMKKLIQNICECCLVICNHIDAMKQSHNAKLQQSILQWLEENFSREDLNMAMVADHFGISKKYVSQFLKDQTGKSYNEYLEELRLSHAMKLLQSSDLSITEIAANCGFSTQNTFYKAFRRRYDLSPSAVRRNQLT